MGCPIVFPSLDLVLRDAVELAVVQPPNFFGETAGNGAGERFVHFIQTRVKRIDGVEHLGFRELRRKRTAVFGNAVVREHQTP